MSTIEAVGLNVLLNAIPVILISIPFIFLRKKFNKKLYKRIFAGIMIFFLVYYIMPVIFQIGEPDTINNGDQNVAAGVTYMFARTFSLIVNYFQLPIINFAFIFVVAPIFALLFLRARMRSEQKAKFRENLAEVTFDLKKSPKDMIREKIQNGDWSDEKQLFKLLIVLLPISLYLLTTILKIAGLELASIQGTSALGWFIEVFFVYLASFLLGIHLLKSANTSFKGRFLGEKLESDASASLITVGIPISVLSILLFIVEYTDSLFSILYFFGYFFMAAFIFISYVAIFEPICITILIKIVDKIKVKKKEHQEIKENAGNKSKQDPISILLPIIFGALSFLVIIIVGFTTQTIVISLTGGNDVEIFIAEAAFDFTQSLGSALKVETIQVIYNIGFILMALIIGYLFTYVIRNTKRISLTALLFMGTFLIMTLTLGSMIGVDSILFGEDVQWITGKLVTTDVFSDSYVILTLRTAFLNAQFDNNVLYYLAIPYEYTRYFASFFILGITFYYLKQRFFKKTIKHENYVEETTFSSLNLLPTDQEFMNDLLLISSIVDNEIPDKERDEVKELYNKALKGISTLELKTGNDSEDKRMLVTLKYMHKKQYIEWWVPEFSFSFERAEMSSLFIMYSDGRDVFTYRFSDEEGETDSALVAGMFSAITAFIKETTKSSDYLRSIDHGDSKITIEYGKHVFGAIFANMQTAEIRNKLKNFVQDFEQKHGNTLVNWNGNCGPFMDDDKLVEKVFEL